MRPQQILELVDDEQREAVLSPAGPLLVVAGAGTGKTRALTCRVAYRVATGQVPATSVLAVTHSTRAAGQMRERFLRLSVDGLEDVAIRTVHAAALRQLQYFWPRLGQQQPLTVCDDRREVMRSGLGSLGVQRPDTGLVVDLVSEVEWAKSQGLTAAAYAEAATEQRRVLPVDVEKVAAAYAAYDRVLSERGQLDFSDLLTRAADMIDTDAGVADEIRRRYSFVCVDEYQDVDPAQQRLIDAWLGSNTDITAVGDPRQAIYGFKGSDRSLFTSFPARYPRSQVVTLSKDYRSTTQVVTVANALARAADPEPGPRPRGRAARAAWLAAHPPALVAGRGDGPTAIARQFEDEDTEAQWVAAQVKAALRSGTPAGEVAILVRYRSQTLAFEQALAAAEVPFHVMDGQRFFDRPDIRVVLDDMTRRLEASAGRSAGFHDESYTGGGAEVLPGAGLLREVLADRGFDRNHPPEHIGEARERWEARAALLRLVEELPSAEMLGSRHLIGELERRRQQAHHVAVDMVTLSTMHQGKGLEWDVVFTPHWVEGSLPSSFARSAAAVEEERRLAYVTVTRARRTLVITHARSRGRGLRGGTVASGSTTRRPSRFLQDAGFGADGAPMAGPSPSRSRRGSTSAAAGSCRRCGSALPDPSLAALGSCPAHLTGEAGRRWVALREWRATMSRIDGLPPYRVLNDATMLALVAAAPADMETMADIKGMGPAKLARYGNELLGILHRRSDPAA